jgi:pullulanase
MTHILSAKIQNIQEIEICFDQPVEKLKVENLHIDNGIQVRQMVCDGNLCRVKTSKFDLAKTHVLQIDGLKEIPLQPDLVLDRYYSDKSLGCLLESGQTVFRLFAPRASEVRLILFQKFDDQDGETIPMVRDENGVWEVLIHGKPQGRYYGYRVSGPKHETEMFDPSVVIADPYSKAVVSLNHYLHPSKSVILNSSDFDWEGDVWLCPKLKDLIIYELHVRDMTAHPSSGVDPGKRGTYSGLVQTLENGGLDYLRSLGINAVELLPVQEFANIEIDYKNPALPVFNTWNAYERNHWGYMTSYFFAPESYYAVGGTIEKGRYNGADGRVNSEFKEMVKAFHRAGIAVIMDVVYNHVSQYDLNPLKYIDKKYYFRLNDDQSFQSLSYCGNDLRTERPMARRLITDSVRYWMEEYHIDGFRFDLATMIDKQTIDGITEMARRVNPDVILIAEPWGGEKYDPHFFSTEGWAAWNDWFRNGIKGEHPRNRPGFVFGQNQDKNFIEFVQKLICGTLAEQGGHFVQSGHSVNYLECHDNCTMGDFIRFALGDISEQSVIKNLDKHIRLTEKQLKINRLAALILLTSQGAVMIHEGQEFARSKVVAKSAVPDAPAGKIDCNSYNKDNETNWIDYSHRDLNSALVDYYRGLIALRKAHPEFRKAKRKDIHFIQSDSESAFGFLIDLNQSKENRPVFVLLNSHPEKEAEFVLPEGKWGVLVDQNAAGTVMIKEITRSTAVPSTSGMVLRRI